ncbi:Uncharacterised protein [Mycobacteroides abscessus subsp. abscessus]|uniref:hypothetical protein n=1 Tax=Mycobacteroides abscessus TaxID=36809 RepID=UPI0009A5AE4E|nr:hypothetical protein [Mycobacteroides abscessus]SKD91959.1 Uncharacterised protein [Mycobacteroides abscessus subsp. abscessus]
MTVEPAQDEPEERPQFWIRRRRPNNPFGDFDEVEIAADNAEAAEHWDDLRWQTGGIYRPGGWG